MHKFPRINLYKVLGLPNFASKEDVKKVCRTLMLVHHPDRGGKKEEAQAINNIREILLKNKEEYDIFLRQMLNPLPAAIKGWDYVSWGNTSNAWTTYTVHFS